MLTLKFDIVNECVKDELERYQLQYSYALRKIFNNLDKKSNEEFKREIRDKYGFGSKMYEYLVGETDAWRKKDEARKKRNSESITRLRKDLEKASSKKKKKINKHIYSLESSLVRSICFGSRELAQELTKNPEDKELRKEWKEKRKYFYLTQGEKHHTGNRFFDFSEFSNGILIFKPNKETKIKIECKITNRSDNSKTKDLIKTLETMAINKQISFCTKFSKNEIHVSYDECVVSDTLINMKKMRIDLKKNIEDEDEDERKEIFKKEMQISWQRIFDKKGLLSRRYLGIDLNPNYVGIVIADKLSDNPEGDFRVIHQEYINYNKLNRNLGLKSSHPRVKSDNNRRRHEIKDSFAYIFELAKHFGVSHFVIEDLEFKKRDLGNKKVNGLINNKWCRELIKETIIKNTNILGMELLEINAAYSSYIGNILYDVFDPVAAATEITRRGMVKFIKGSSIFPPFHTPWFANGIDNKLSIKMDGWIEECDDWKELCVKIKKSGVNVRRKLKPIQFSKKNQRKHKSRVSMWSLV